MNSPRIEIVESLAPRLCELIVDALRDAISLRGTASIVLAGGSTPQAAYRLLVSEDVDWARVEWFFGDERFVPVDDERSNERIARECLLEPLGIAEEKIHGMVRFDSVNESAEAYDSLVRCHLPFDLVLLGLGDDAHTLSLFPGEPGVFESEKLVIAAKAPVLAFNRITLTPPAVWNCHLAILATAGENKRDALAKALDSESEWLDSPSRAVLQGIQNAVVLYDAAAAGRDR